MGDENERRSCGALHERLSLPAPIGKEKLAQLFSDLTFFAFLLMLDQRTLPSSDTPL